MRRGHGIGGFVQKDRDKAAYAKIGEKSKAENMRHIKASLQIFKQSIEDFASKHRDRINSDPEFRWWSFFPNKSIPASGYLARYQVAFFRHQFVRMCTSMKVDPLASSKGGWTHILGLGDYYFQLAVIVAEVALQRRGYSGGVIALSDILKILRSPSSPRALRDVSEEDIKRAVSKLSVLGNGFRLAEVAICLDLCDLTLLLSDNAWQTLFLSS